MTRLGDLLHFGQLFKACRNNYLPKSPTFLGNFCKGVEIFHLWATFVDIFSTFYWSHWSRSKFTHFELQLPMSRLHVGVNNKSFWTYHQLQSGEEETLSLWQKYVCVGIVWFGRNFFEKQSNYKRYEFASFLGLRLWTGQNVEQIRYHSAKFKILISP